MKNTSISWLRVSLFVVVILISFLNLACASAQEGTATVQVVRSKISQVIRPEHGWVNTAGTFGDEYYEVGLRSSTDEVEVDASTKDNAALKLKIAVTSSLKTDDASILAFVRKFGLSSEERTNRLQPIVVGHINTETKNAVSEFEAYSLLANQEIIQQTVLDKLRKIYSEQMFRNVESVQIIGRPDFVDDRIEQAASAVVANQKAREAAQADLERARVEAEKKQVEAQTFKDPALLQIKLLELKLDIERAKAEGIKGHNGSLTIVEGSASTQLQLRQ